jgi:plasmid stability protein
MALEFTLTEMSIRNLRGGTGVKRGLRVRIATSPPSVSLLSRAVVSNLWYAYPWEYAKIILVMAENIKKGVKIKTQKQSYEVLVYKERDLCESCH